MHNALLVGAGGMGQAWADNLTAHPDVTLAGWVDIRPNAAAEAAAQKGLPNLWTGDNLLQAIADTRPDFVVDVTVPEAHAQVTIAALNAGLPVLGEKPMAAGMDDARRMTAMSEASGRLYMVSQSRRYNAHLAAFKRLLQREIGAPGILNADFYLAPHFGGFRDTMPSPLILDMAIHTFDAARYLINADPVSVYCEEYNPPWSWYAGDAASTALFTFADGCRFTYRGCWCAEGQNTSWESQWRAVGPGGTAVWDGTNAATAQRPGQTNTATEPPDPSQPYGIAGSLAEFLVALNTGHVPMGECHDNIKSLAMVFAAMRSAREGRRVEVEW